MMMTLLVLKSRMQTFYEKHYNVTRIIIKTLFVFLSLLMITGKLGYSSFFDHIAVLLFVSVFCGFMPDTTACGVLFFVYFWEIVQVVPILGISLLLLVMIYFLIMGRVVKGQEYMILLVPLLSCLNLQYAVPIIAALFVSPLMLPALTMGLFFQHTLEAMIKYINISVAAGETLGTSQDVVWTPMRYVLDYLMNDTLLFVSATVYIVAFIVVYAIRRSKIKRSSQIAILVGGLVCLMMLLFGNIMFELGLQLFYCLLYMLITFVLAYIIQFFRMTLDYHGTRKLQFEDDEYYYYVTAIPKYKVAVTDKTVTRIVPDNPEEIPDLKDEIEKTLEEEKETPQ